MHCRLFRSLKKRRKNKDGLLFCGSCCFSLVMYLKINNVSIRERKKREKAMKKGEVKLSRQLVEQELQSGPDRRTLGYQGYTSSNDKFAG